MAGSISRKQKQPDESQSPELIASLVVDMDDVPDGFDETEVGERKVGNGKMLFAKSAEIRRRIEERLEVKLLKDELGMDDFDI